MAELRWRRRQECEWVAQNYVPYFHCEAYLTLMLKIAITIDDLPCKSLIQPNESNALAERLLHVCGEIQEPVTGFVNAGQFRNIQEGISFAQRWSQKKLLLANHTHSHFSLHNCSSSVWENNVIRGEMFLHDTPSPNRETFTPFRHPYLDMGLTRDQRKKAAAFLASRGYTI